MSYTTLERSYVGAPIYLKFKTCSNGKHDLNGISAHPEQRSCDQEQWFCTEYLEYQYGQNHYVTR